jgi:hypothetical protein
MVEIRRCIVAQSATATFVITYVPNFLFLWNIYFSFCIFTLVSITGKNLLKSRSNVTFLLLDLSVKTNFFHHEGSHVRFRFWQLCESGSVILLFRILIRFRILTIYQ